MIRKQRGTTVWYEFDLLQPFPWIRHGCLTCHSSMNLAPSHREDRRLMAAALFGSPSIPLIGMHQAHGTHVACISSPSSPLEACDAMVTSLHNIALLVVHADCQACIFVDPEHQVIANVHSGWRGSVQNIYKATIEQLQSKWGTRPEELIACISPSLGPCHAEFTNWKEELPASFEPFRKENDHFDFWEISRHQLLSCGLSASHIEIAGLCTYCHPDLFFSYRRTRTAERNATCIALME